MLSERELELYAEGYQQRIEIAERLLAWVQANLINAQIPKGKPKLTVDKLMRGKKRGPSPTTEERKQALREREADEDARAFWASPEGRRLAMLDDEAA